MEGCAVCEQVHGNQVAVIGPGFKGRSIFEQDSAIPAADGMIADKNIGLMAFFADCVPLFLQKEKNNRQDGRIYISGERRS